MLGRFIFYKNDVLQEWQTKGSVGDCYSSRREEWDGSSLMPNIEWSGRRESDPVQGEWSPTCLWRHRPTRGWPDDVRAGRLGVGLQLPEVLA